MFVYEENLEKLLEHKRNNYNDFKKNYIIPYVDTISNKSCLEIGYGSDHSFGGFYMTSLYNDGAKTPVFGIDVTNYYTNNLEEKIKWNNLIKEKISPYADNFRYEVWNKIPPHIIKLHMNAADMYFKNEMFDIIYSSAVLEHVYDIDLVFKEMYRVLRKDGICVHSWNPYASLTMGAHDIGIPFYFPWPHLRLSKNEHLEKLNEVFSNPNLRKSSSVMEHTISEEIVTNINIEELYNNTMLSLNKVSVNNLIQFATDAGFKILNHWFNYDSRIDALSFLTTDVEHLKNTYSVEELTCTSHAIILQKQ